MNLHRASSMGDGRGCSRLQTWLVLGLILMGLAVFAGVCGHDFVQWDDNVNIYNNPQIQGLTAEHVRWMFTNTEYARRYMPVGWLSYAGDFELFGLNPHAYHAGNLFIYLINVVLVFFLVKRLLLWRREEAASATDPRLLWSVALGTVFWAVNPLRVEVVGWASSRIYGVALLFVLLWIAGWLNAQDESISPQRRRWFYWGSVVAYALSLLTYPLALFAPIVLLALETLLLQRLNGPLIGWWRERHWPVWRDKLPFVLVSGAVLLLTFISRWGSDARYAPVTLTEFPLSARVMQAFYVWGYYLWKPFAPYDLTISYMTLHSFNPWSWPFLLSLGLVLGVSAGCYLARRRWPVLGWLWLCHLVILVPVLGLSEYPHSAYDRYSYLPGLLIVVGLALLLHWAWRRTRAGFLPGAAIAGASAIFALLSWQQVGVWSNSIPLYEQFLRVAGGHPDRSRFDFVLGANYLRVGLTNQALASFQHAVDYETKRLEHSVLNEGVLPAALVQLGDILSNTGQFEDALGQYQAALRADNASLGAGLGVAAALLGLHRESEALQWLKDAARLHPQSTQAHHQLAVLLERQGETAEARTHFEIEARLRRERGLLAGP